MPFKSDKQRRYLYAEKPKVAKKFAMDSAKKGKMTKLRTGGPQDHGQEAKSKEKGFDQSDRSNPYSNASKSAQAAENKAISDRHSRNNPTTTAERKFYNPPPQIPTIGPASWALNKAINYVGPKAYDYNKKKKEKFARKEGLYRDFYRTNKTPLEVMDPKNKDYMKDAGYGKNKNTNDNGGGEGRKKCLDGSLPPCAPVASKPEVKVEPVKKKQIFDDFKAYKKGKMIKKNKGGGVPYGPPPLRGPNPQVPPVKFSRGGGAAIRGLKFTGVK
jgi:hypothetical protein